VVYIRAQLKNASV